MKACGVACGEEQSTEWPRNSCSFRVHLLGAPLPAAGGHAFEACLTASPSQGPSTVLQVVQTPVESGGLIAAVGARADSQPPPAGSGRLIVRPA